MGLCCKPAYMQKQSSLWTASKYDQDVIKLYRINKFFRSLELKFDHAMSANTKFAVKSQSFAALIDFFIIPYTSIKNESLSF